MIEAPKLHQDVYDTPKYNYKCLPKPPIKAASCCRRLFGGGGEEEHMGHISPISEAIVEIPFDPW